MRLKAIIILLLSCSVAFAQESVKPRLVNYPKIHIFRPDRGPTRDLKVLTNDSCENIPCIDSMVTAYMARFSIQGASLAVMRNDSLLYVKGYGWADKDAGVAMQPNNIMRVASVSKLVTAIGIMKLQDEGRLNIKDKVFGPRCVLGSDPITAGIIDQRVLDITIEHLLRHQAGFIAKHVDPMFSPGMVDGRECVAREISKTLAFDPGSDQDYSNVGFYILSMIIEKITGQDYATWTQENVLRPMGCFNFRTAGNYLKDRLPYEVHYYMHPGCKFEKDFHNDGRMVERCYGSNNVAGIKGAGAWATSAPELCRMVAGIDNEIGLRDLLSEQSIKQMTKYIAPEVYSLGWNDTNAYGIWTRTGSFSGTTAIIKNYSWDGDCWVLLTNTSTCLGSKVSKQSSALIEKLRETSMGLLAHKDLFYSK